jgi:hypothetical protein
MSGNTGFRYSKKDKPAVINPDVKRVKYQENASGDLQSSPPEDQNTNLNQSTATSTF